MKEHQGTDPFAPHSVPAEKTLDIEKPSSLPPAMSVSEQFGDWFSPVSHSEAVGDLARCYKTDCVNGSLFNSSMEDIDQKPLAPRASTENGSSSPPLTTLADQSLNPNGSSQNSVPASPVLNSDINPTNEEEKSSPSNRLDNKLIGYDSSFQRSSSWASELSYSSLTSSSRWSSFTSSSRWSSFSSSDEARPDLGPSLSTHERKPSMVGAGLENLGNTCFMNAVLQCLTHTVSLVQGLRSYNHQMPCHTGSGGFCLLCALNEHVELSLTWSGGVVSPSTFADNLNYISTYFWRHQQEDAHEFLQCFLDKFERCFLMSNSNEPCSPGENLVKSVFGGRLMSRLQCCNCGHSSYTYESLVDLSLEIDDMDSLPTALESFTKVEKIEGSETKFTCENCKEEVALEKQLMVDQAPSVAAFHLKRFKAYDCRVEKINNHVEFPLELDLDFCTIPTSDDEVELKYDLYAIIVHKGSSPNCGHYFCFIRSSPSTWHVMDDSEVTEVQEEYVLSQKAYILFYARRGTPWFSSMVDEKKMCLHQSNGAPSVLDNSKSGFVPYSDVSNVSISGCDQSKGPEATSKVEVYELRDDDSSNPASRVCGLDPCSSKDIRVGLNSYCDGSLVTDGLLPPKGSNCSEEMAYNQEKTCSKNDCPQVINEVGIDNDVFHCLTPPRSPSPDTLPTKSPGVIYQIPREHLKKEKRVTGKRLLNNVPDDSEKKEAIRYVTRSLPSSRANKLISAMMGSESEGSLRKKKKLESPCLKVPSRARCKSNHGSAVQPVTATVLR